MIVDIAENLAQYVDLHPDFGTALKFLWRADLAELPDGRTDIDGDQVFALVASDPGRGQTQARLEGHQRYIDIQLVIDGEERIGWRNRASCTEAADGYDQDRDLVFFTDLPTTWVDLQPGMLAVFFPNDAHAPLAGNGLVRKVVIKVRVSG